MRFIDYIEKTLENEIGYKWGRGWQTEFDKKKKILTLVHYGTEILKLKYHQYYKPEKIEVLDFRIGSLSDNQGIYNTLPQGMYAEAYYGHSLGHFHKTIKGYDINTRDAICSYITRGTADCFYLCHVGNKVRKCFKREESIKYKYDNYFLLDDNSIIKAITNKKRPFKYKRVLAFWKCKELKSVFPLVCSLDGYEVYRCEAPKAEDIPQDVLNKFVAIMV